MQNIGDRSLTGCTNEDARRSATPEQADFFKVFLNVNPRTNATSFRFHNQAPVRDVYDTWQEYCNSFEPLILDDALERMISCRKSLPLRSNYSELPLGSIQAASEGTEQHLTPRRPWQPL